MKKKSSKKRNWPFVLIFILGAMILAYPQFTRMYYNVNSKIIISTFDEEKKKLSEEEIKKRLDLAKAYNESLKNVINEDPYSKERKKRGRDEYARMLEIKEYIGHIQIPKINVDIPIHAGTSEDVLQKGAGHLEGTSLPVGGINSHTVITSHTGLPTAKLFTDLDKIEVGDKFYIHNLAEVLAYEVDQIKVVKPSNFSDLVVVENKDYATLLTCTPYMINTHRLLVRGHRIPYVADDLAQDNKNVWLIIVYIIGSLLLLIFLIVWYILYKRKKRKNREVDKREE